MDDYSIWKDFFDTIQSFPDWLKLAGGADTTDADRDSDPSILHLPAAPRRHRPCRCGGNRWRRQRGNVSAVAGKRGGSAVRSAACFARSAGQLSCGIGQAGKTRTILSEIARGLGRGGVLGGWSRSRCRLRLRSAGAVLTGPGGSSPP